VKNLARWRLMALQFAGSSLTDARRPSVGLSTVVPTSPCNALKTTDLTALGGVGSTVAAVTEGLGAQAAPCVRSKA
jgi:hypothetical protein